MDTDVLVTARRPRELQDTLAWCTLTAAGVAIGLATWGVVADVFGYSDNPLLMIFLIGGNAPGPWAVGAFVVGAVAVHAGARLPVAIIWSVAALVGADALYYAGQVVAGSRTSADAVVSAGVVWGAAAVGAGVALGAAGAVWAGRDRHGDRAGAVAVGMLSAVLVAEAAYVMPHDIGRLDLGRATYAIVDVAIAVALVRLVAPHARSQFLQTLIVLGVIGSVTAAWILAVIHSAIR